jgi:hypothetical protein
VSPRKAATAPEGEEVDEDRLRQQQALERVGDWWEGLHRRGLQGLDPRAPDELLALSQWCHTAGLVNLEREVDQVATLARRYAERDPLFPPTGWLQATSRVWWAVRRLQSALSRGDVDAVDGMAGEARREYKLLADELVVQAVGASGWVSDSGFVGVTVYLSSAKGLVQASIVRPSSFFGDDPKTLLSQPLAEGQAVSLRDLAHGAWVMGNVKISADHRLSLHRELGLGPIPGAGSRALTELALPGFRAALGKLRAAGLDEGAEPLALWLWPLRMGIPVVDEIHARVRVPFVDAAGAQVEVDVLMRPENNLLLDNLDRIGKGEAPAPDGWFGRVWVAGGRLRFQPITALYRVPLQMKRGKKEVHEVHLTLESLEGMRP